MIKVSKNMFTNCTSFLKKHTYTQKNTLIWNSYHFKKYHSLIFFFFTFCYIWVSGFHPDIYILNRIKRYLYILRKHQAHKHIKTAFFLSLSTSLYLSLPAPTLLLCLSPKLMVWKALGKWQWGPINIALLRVVRLEHLLKKYTNDLCYKQMSSILQMY